MRELDSELPQGEVLRVTGWSESAEWVYAGVVLLLGLMTFFAFPVHHPAQAWNLRVLGLGLIGLAVSFGRGAMSGIWVRPEGIRLRTKLRTYSLAWDDIEEFRLGQTPYRRRALTVVLKRGQKIRSLGFWARRPVERERAVQLAVALERRRRASSAAGN